MEGSGDGSPQSSMCMVKAAELFPKPVLEKEEEKLSVRFSERKYKSCVGCFDCCFIWKFYTHKNNK